MVLRSFLLVVALTIAGAIAQAQVVVNYNDMVKYFALNVSVDAQAGTATSFNVGNADLINAQRFDCSGMAFAAATTRSYVAPSMTPHAADFPQATFAFQSDALGIQAWEYIQMDPTGVNLLGAENDSVRQKLRTPLQMYPFPLSVGNQWAPPATRGDSLTINFGGTPIKIATMVSQSGSCDAWGLLSTPRGAWPCLRVKMTRTVTGIAQGIPPTQIFKAISYEYHTKDGEVVTVDIDSTDDNKSQVTPKRITYTHLPGAPPTSVEESNTPNTLTLATAYPNPARMSSTLTYALTERSAVTVELVNMLGAKIATLVSGPQAAGAHQASIDLSAFPAGSYMCRLTVNGRTSATRVVVTK